jgi:hypothetical protein
MHSPRSNRLTSVLAAFSLPLLPMSGHAGPGPVEIPVFLTLNKSAAYTQSVSGEVTLLGATPYTFLAIAFGAPDVLSLTNVVLSLPSGDTEPLIYSTGAPLPFPGWLLSFPFANSSLADSDYPVGNYLYTFDYDVLGAAKGTVRAPLPFSGDLPPTPSLVNLAAAQHICAGADFILESVPFEGATGSDQVTAQITTVSDEPTILFSTNAVPRGTGPVQLRVPANTLQPDTDYVLRLAYDRIAGVGFTNTPPLLGGAAVIDVTARSSHSRITSIPLHTELCPRLQVTARQDSGIARLRFDTTPGGAYELQASSNLVTWETLLTTNASAGSLELTPKPAAGEGSQFYRIRRP